MHAAQIAAIAIAVYIMEKSREFMCRVTSYFGRSGGDGTNASKRYKRETGAQANIGWQKLADNCFCELWIPCYMDGRSQKSKSGAFAEARVS